MDTLNIKVRLIVMQIPHALGLGVLQGLTEFLPVSSSGHLATAQHFLGYEAEKEILFDVVLHIGTLIAILWIYRASLKEFILGGKRVLIEKKEGSFFQRFWAESSMRELFFLGLATIPTGLIGILFRKELKSVFGSLSTIAFLFAFTGVILWVTRWKEGGAQKIANITWWSAIIIGFAQGFAILPGISRSGTTIACALLLGMRRDDAARFSFLLAIPAISGATLLELRGLNMANVNWLPLVLGGIAAVITGYLALRFLIHIVREGKLSWFAIYLWILSASIFVKLYI